MTPTALWLAGCLRVFGNRPDKAPHWDRTYPAAHSMGISEIPRLHKDVPPLRFQKCPFSAMLANWRWLIRFGTVAKKRTGLWTQKSL